MGFLTASILDLLSFGDDSDKIVKRIISSFSCNINKEIDDFLKKDAIDFAKMKIAITYLIFEEHDYSLLGYYTLANKTISISKSSVSKTMQKRLCRYFKENDDGDLDGPCYLIAQLSKNMSIKNNSLTGSDIINDALLQLADAQKIVGGGFVYLECEDKNKLLDFYKNSGFVFVDERDSDEGIRYKRLIRKI